MPFQTLDLAAFCGGCIIFAGSLRRFLDKAQDKAKLKFMGMARVPGNVFTPGWQNQINPQA